LLKKLEVFKNLDIMVLDLHGISRIQGCPEDAETLNSFQLLSVEAPRQSQRGVAEASESSVHLDPQGPNNNL
jgi:hypothetical protein